MKKILFVCTGNTCRSPMAEAIFNSRCPKEYQALSAGLSTSGGKPVSEHSVEALAEIGLSILHKSVQITEELVKESDWVVGITSHHAAMLKNLFPSEKGKILSFPDDISDPYGCDLDTYRRCRDQITRGMDKLLMQLCHE